MVTFDGKNVMPKQFAWKSWAAANWFVIVAPFLLLVSFLFTRSVDWEGSGAVVEAVTVFDWCVSIPLLYYLCYRRTLPARQMLLRLLALACLGVWIAGRLVPAGFQEILRSLGGRGRWASRSWS